MKNVRAKYLVAIGMSVCGERINAQAQPLPEVDHSAIGYATVAEALAALQNQPGVEISIQGGWTIARDKKGNELWSFAPKGNPAFPSAVKRSISERYGMVYVDMNVLCQASKLACDQLVSDFEKLNDRLRESLQH